MFTRKPKNIVSKVIDLTNPTSAQQASHTWMREDTTRSARFGSTSRETFSQRRQIDKERSVVSRYADSKIASSAITGRGDISRAARSERNERVLQNGVEGTTTQISNPIPPAMQNTPTPDNAFYPDFRPKL